MYADSSTLIIGTACISKRYSGLDFQTPRYWFPPVWGSRIYVKNPMTEPKILHFATSIRAVWVWKSWREVNTVGVDSNTETLKILNYHRWCWHQHRRCLTQHLGVDLILKFLNRHQPGLLTLNKNLLDLLNPVKKIQTIFLTKLLYFEQKTRDGISRKTKI